MEENKYKALVLDSGAFINYASIVNAAEEYYSIEEVMSEVRDRVAREKLDRFPFEIKLRRPSKEAIEIVEKFAKSTGDFSRLAQTDLLIIALTYDIQKEVGGVDHVNVNCLFDRSRIVDVHEKRIVGINVSAEPCKYVNSPTGCKFGDECLYRHPGDIDRSSLNVEKKVDSIQEVPKRTTPLRTWNVVKPMAFGKGDAFPALGSHTTQEEEEKKKRLYHNPEIQEMFGLKKEVVGGVEGVDEVVSEIKVDEGVSEIKVDEGVSERGVDEGVSERGVDEGGVEGVDKGVSEIELDKDNSPIEYDNASTDTALMKAETPSTESINESLPKSHILNNSSTLVSQVAEDDGGEWIDSLSLSSFHNNTNSTIQTEEDSIDRSQFAACCTGDYAMQNVLLQMNLQLLSYENKRITTLKIFTRRCRDCFAICHDETKLFCQECGHPSLAKVPVSVLKGGIVRVGMPYESKSLRGTIYSVGKNADLLYCEDQLHSGKWLRRVQNMKRAKKEGCIFGDVGAESLGLGASTSHQNDYLDSVVVGFGRRNPNAMKGREKRGKKKAKKASRY